ncbi:hypothetical protein DH2020_020592 [Rehmannia glutinosa]|uniref:Uncharacterized protein n=1 Tax=Rehmannia glutinosa TaxID=99300 RepID=A0ABR0WGG8_REHGL
MRREVAAMEKEVAAMRVDKEHENRAKRLGNSKSSLNSSQMLPGSMPMALWLWQEKKKNHGKTMRSGGNDRYEAKCEKHPTRSTGKTAVHLMKLSFKAINEQSVRQTAREQARILFVTMKLVDGDEKQVVKEKSSKNKVLDLEALMFFEGSNLIFSTFTAFLTSPEMATMESLIGLVNRIQRACTVLGDHGGEGMSLWEALPSVAVVGGQSSGKSSVLESVVGRDFLPRGSGIVTRRPLVLQLHKTEGQTEYAEFLHAPKKKFTDFGMFKSRIRAFLDSAAAVRQEIADETDRITGKSKQISNIPIHLSIYSPNEGQPESIVEDIENMVRSYVEKENCIILAISPANQDIATSDAIKLAREVDPAGRAYRLVHPWVGIVNRSQADINKNVNMGSARQKEREYFESSPEYGHLAHKMGSEYLAKLLSQAQLYTILEMCRAFDRIFKEHLDGGHRRPGGDKIYGVFDHQLPAALKKLPFDRHLSQSNVRKVISEADGYQPHLIAPEQGYRRLIDGSLGYFKGPAEASVDAWLELRINVLLASPSLKICVTAGFELCDLAKLGDGAEYELKRFPTLQSDIAAAANEALEKFRDESRKAVSRLVEMESSYLTVEFFRKLNTEPEKTPNITGPNAERYTDNHLRRIGTNVSAYIGMVCDTLKNSIPKAVVHCQVREAKRSLLNLFYAQIGRREKEQLGKMLDEDPSLMAKRETIAKRLELYKSARDEIDSVAWK